jgi:hypothetical protein
MAKVAFIGTFALLAAVAAAGSLANAETDDRTITKVIKLLQEMMAKSKEDGEKDTELFAKYKCYCDVNEAKKNKAIASATETIALLSGQIAELQAANGQMATESAELESAIGENERARQSATSIRDKASKDFDEEKADMENGLEQMGKAIETLEAISYPEEEKSALLSHKQQLGKEAKKASLIKLTSSIQNIVKTAALFLPHKQKKVLYAFLQAPFAGISAKTGGEIVGILKTMKETFKTNLDNAQKAEEAAGVAYESFMKAKTVEHEQLRATFTDKDKMMSDNDEALSSKKTTKGELETSKAEDEEFVAKLAVLCAQKTKDYEDRKMVRSGEEAAVAQAISILNSDSAFDTFGATKAATEGGTGLLQVQLQRRHKDTRNLALRRLTRSARRTKSLRLAKVAAMLEGGNPFDKICGEVEKMIALIEKEEAQDHEQLEWCSSERDSNHEQKQEKQDMINMLDDKKTELMDVIENEETGLKKLLADENAHLAENQKQQSDETIDRNAERAAYVKNKKNLDEAEKTLDKALKVLQKFYDWLHAKTGPHHYEEKSGKDVSGENLKRMPAASTEELEEACTADPACAGFNTNGWMKTSVAEDKIMDGSGSLYVKVFDTENPVGFAQLSARTSREEPAPPEDGFSETGKGKGGDAVGMLSYILQETEAEEQAADESEQNSQQAYDDTMADLKSQESTSLDTIADLSEQLAEKEKSLAETTTDLTKTVTEHKAIEKYLLKIKPGCDFITEHVEERDEHRKEEVEALHTAEATLKETPVYKKAVETAHKESLGECAEKCPADPEAEKDLACKACVAGTSEDGFCEAHPNDDVCL